MQTQSRFVWIGLIIVIAFGLTIELMKSTHFSADGSAWHPFGQDLEDSNDTLNPYHRSAKSSNQAQRARSRLLHGRIAGLGPVTATTATVAPSVEVPASTATNLAAPAVNADDAKKKADEAKKKKKKKKKKTTSEEQPNANQGATPNSDGRDDQAAANSGGAHSFVAGGAMQARTFIGGAASFTENPETLEQWKTYILREPSYERTMRLIQAQQKHAIDSDIFHEVVSEMLSDSRLKMHEYAVLALGSSPGLESFLLLQSAARAQPEGSSLRLQARTYLKAYSKLENLRYLASVIASETEASTAFEALRLIQIAVSTYKPSPAQTSSRPGTFALVAKQFTPFVSILTRLAATSKDATVQQEASQTLSDVTSLIGNVSGPAV
jgi:hypothetical protein